MYQGKYINQIINEILKRRYFSLDLHKVIKITCMHIGKSQESYVVLWLNDTTRYKNITAIKMHYIE